jgi:two-component system, cell cycle sensor histidine kinase and response regulator CckA
MKILVVDDSENSRLITSILLKDNGHTVMNATNGNEALGVLAESQIDLIITDILMPEMDGFELCRQVHANPEWKHVLIIIYTGTYTTRRSPIVS